MGLSFQKHYTREEAKALLPKIREWLGQLQQLRQSLTQKDKRICGRLEQGEDLGGEMVNEYIKVVCGLRRILREFAEREIQLKDLERGLIDFPAIIGGKEVFLCWEQDEEDIEFWHELDTGYAGRERL
ncbi:MAG TPA: DUF2203 domain-containing protein [Candidatus Saccharimonadales bacterium]|nr:DUF2203 domain-containing protein [Candidatus Saccharimonadales bacterium]